jgi:hypothetical protein
LRDAIAKDGGGLASIRASSSSRGKRHKTFRVGEIRIEFRDGSETLRVPVKRGQVGWDEPLNRAHRAVNIGQEPYEEITIFFLDHPDAVPQPHDD